MDEPTREQAFVTALVTEHFVQGSARAATITESNGRAAIYLSAVSSGLVAFGFLAQGARRLDPFVAAVLPALFILGVFTFVRLVQTSIESAVLTLKIQRIRGYFAAWSPRPNSSSTPPAPTMPSRWALATSGNRASPVEMLYTAAAMIAAVNSILGGAGLALLAGKLAPLGSASALMVGAVGTVILFGLHLLYGYRRAAPTVGWSPRWWAVAPVPHRTRPVVVERALGFLESSLLRGRWSSPNWPWSGSDQAPTPTHKRQQEVTT